MSVENLPANILDHIAILWVEEYPMRGGLKFCEC